MDTPAPLRREPVRAPSAWQETLRHLRYVATENPVTLGAFLLFMLFVVLAIFGPWLAPFDPLATDTTAALQPPSLRHWFGTDALGRDIFSRIVVATQLDFGIAVAAVFASFVVGASFSRPPSSTCRSTRACRAPR
jgi:peptide/nickel transport system permease protein